MKKAKRFEVTDLGIEHEQFFQGFGVSNTEYDSCAVGIGNSEAGALDDCLEQIAMLGDVDAGDLEARILAREGNPSIDLMSGVCTHEWRQYIGIRWTI